MSAPQGNRRRSVLITGAGGFIAGYLARRLASDGWTVYGVDRPGIPLREQPSQRCRRPAWVSRLPVTSPQFGPMRFSTRHSIRGPEPWTSTSGGPLSGWLKAGRQARQTQVLLSSLSADAGCAGGVRPGQVGAGAGSSLASEKSPCAWAWW